MKKGPSSKQQINGFFGFPGKILIYKRVPKVISNLPTDYNNSDGKIYINLLVCYLSKSDNLFKVYSCKKLFSTRIVHKDRLKYKTKKSSLLITKY